MYNIVIALVFILYSLNINLFLLYSSKFKLGEDTKFFQGLKNTGKDVFYIMQSYQKLIIRANYLFIIVGCFILIKELIF